jgi:hypothetical protein
MKRMKKYLVTVFFALALPALADEFTKLEIHVLSPTGRGIENASVTVKFAANLPKDKDKPPSKKLRKEWDVKTNQDGVIKLPTIPKGYILIQVRADNYQTFGQTFEVKEDDRVVEIKLNPPQPQYSAHDKDKDK